MNLARLAVSIGICQLAGVIGSIFTASSVSTWYAALAKPAFTPPSWLFAPVWVLLYTLMGVALYLVWNDKKKAKKQAITTFSIQLFLNALWPALFFGLRQPWVAFWEIALLWLAITAAIFQFSKVSRPAAILLAPYLIWTSFAVVLNLAVAVG